MKRSIAAIALVCTLVGTWKGLAQGTVSFANIGGGVNAPIFGPDGPLGVGWTVQLCFAEGTPIGDPAPILVNGLFSGGPRTIPGVAPGRSADLAVKAFSPSGAFAVQSGSFSVVLGGGAVPPAAMTSMPRITVHQPLVSCSHYESVTGEPCWWEDSPWLLELQGPPPPVLDLDGESLPPLNTLRPKVVTYHIIDGGLELRWPNEYRLVGSTSLGGINKVAVRGTDAEDGMQLRRIHPTAAQGFFWLE